MKRHFVFILLFLTILLSFETAAQAQHIVKPNETLSQIAKNNNVSLTKLINLNPHIENPNLIHPNDYIIIPSLKPKKDLVDYARSLQDITAYSYGAQNPPYLTDCSGWVQYIYKKFGVSLPRTSRQQSLTGNPVPFSKLELGDLMFFSTRLDKEITHVGIYLGNDYWISNLNDLKDVEILSSWGAWTQKYFLWGSRYEI